MNRLSDFFLTLYIRNFRSNFRSGLPSNLHFDHGTSSHLHSDHGTPSQLSIRLELPPTLRLEGGPLAGAQIPSYYRLLNVKTPEIGIIIISKTSNCQLINLLVGSY